MTESSLCDQSVEGPESGHPIGWAICLYSPSEKPVFDRDMEAMSPRSSRAWACQSLVYGSQRKTKDLSEALMVEFVA